MSGSTISHLLGVYGERVRSNSVQDIKKRNFCLASALQGRRWVEEKEDRLDPEI